MEVATPVATPPAPAAVMQHDALSSVLSNVSLPQLVTASKVSNDWHAAVYSGVLASLEVLDLRAHAGVLTDEMLAQLLRACPLLKELNLFGCKSLTNASVSAISAHCPRLTSLNLGCIPTITADELQQCVAQLPITDLEYACGTCTIAHRSADIRISDVSLLVRQAVRLHGHS